MEFLPLCSLIISVILLSLFYSRIQAASQSKKGLYFPNFGDFFPNLRILLGFIPISKMHRLYPKKGNKITAYSYELTSDSVDGDTVIFTGCGSSFSTVTSVVSDLKIELGPYSVTPL